MKIPITRFGMPQVAFFSFDIAGLMILLAVTVDNPAILWPIEAVLLMFLIWILAFFRDPRRRIPEDSALLLSPADGKITDIEMVDDSDCKGRKLIRIGIFLSIFDVHINRAPCRVKIESVKYVAGRFKNALSPQATKINESNDMVIKRLDEPCHKITVRQISGAIARRIVCNAKIGDELAAGQKFGMIKFGSRTEIYVPEDVPAECVVRVGQKVTAGETILMKYTKNA